MEIRKAVLADLEKIMPMYDRARIFMAENHNPKQWGDGYPQKEVIASDIQDGNYYVCVMADGEKLQKDADATAEASEEEICGGFALIFGEDDTYAVIEEGAWLNDAPYATIHRLVSAGTQQGVAEACFAWCSKRYKNLRIDTHEDNHIMQYAIKKAGFLPCGKIYVRDGTPRLAFHRADC